MSVRISTPRMTTEPSIRLWEERKFGLINSLTGLLTVLMAPRPSRELPPPQVPANWAVLRILAQSPNFADRRWSIPQNRGDQLGGGISSERPLPGGHIVQHYAQREDRGGVGQQA